MQVSANLVNGKRIHTYDAPTKADAVSYMVTQSAADFVHGYSVEGIGIIIVVRTENGHPVGFRKLVGNEFVTGGPDIIFSS